MRRYLKKTTLIAVFVSLLFYGGSITHAVGKRAGEAVVKVKNNAQITSIAAEVQVVVADSIPSKRTYLLKFSNDRSVDEVIEMLNKNVEVELASYNTSIDIPETFQISQGFPDESEPIFNHGLSPKNFYAQAGSYNIGIDSAQLLSTGNGVIIAVIDNGLDYSHPLIQNSSILTGHDFISQGNKADEQPGTIFGHGTFVTGLLLLTAPDASILPLRAFDGDGVGDQFNVAKAIDWAVRHGADIINMSFGTIELNDVLKDAIEDATDNNIVMVAASGNDGSSVQYYPAAHPDVIAVASVDTLELFADFSNYGDYIDIVAPGVNMYSALAGEFNWGTWSGTSFSAPVVSGTIAMMKQIESNYSPLEIQNHLRNSSRTELLWGDVIVPDIKYGYGMLNSFNAVAQLSIGDLDGSGTRDISDLSIMIELITNQDKSNEEQGKVGEERENLVITEAMLDLNCDGNANVSDIAVMVHHIFVKWHDFKPCVTKGGNSK